MQTSTKETPLPSPPSFVFNPSSRGKNNVKHTRPGTIRAYSVVEELGKKRHAPSLSCLVSCSRRKKFGSKSCDNRSCRTGREELGGARLPGASPKATTWRAFSPRS